jgi:hypothetical protein
MSENEQEVPLEEPAPSELEPESEPTEVPEGVDPETGEVVEDAEPDEDDAEAEAENQRRAEIAAERQEAEQAQAASEVEMERQQKALDRATKAYTDKLRAALGDDLSGFQPCPMCADGWPGIRLPVMPAPENVAAIKVAIGEDPDPDLPSDGYSRRCESCDGWGRVQTGSRVTTQKAAICHDCAGQGWVAVGDERAAGNITPGNGAAVQPVPVLQDNPNNDPPEVAMLQQLGYMVTKVPKIEGITLPPGFGG